MNPNDPNGNVRSFLAQMAQSLPRAKGDYEKKQDLEKIYLNIPENLGKYQILPVSPVTSAYPFVPLYGTREVYMPIRRVGSDGTERVFSSWIKLLPKSAYVMNTPDGRQVSSLTAEEDSLLNQAYELFDQLFGELDARNNRSPEVTKLIRVKNYTVFNAFCLNRWVNGNMRTADRQNFSGLFVLTTKSFATAISEDIESRTLMNNGDYSWLETVYSSAPSGRDGFVFFTIGPNPTGTPGFAVTASHELGQSGNLSRYPIPAEDLEKMTDPVATFLGWQAKRDDDNVPGQKRLFNAKLTQDLIDFMIQQVSAIRMAKQTGLSPEEAIKRTNDLAASGNPTNSQAAPMARTNDPLLAAQSPAEQPAPSFGQAQASMNTNPYSTPPAAHINPLTSAPEAPGESGQPSAPSFQSGFGGTNGDLPF